MVEDDVVPRGFAEAVGGATAGVVGEEFALAVADSDLSALGHDVLEVAGDDLVPVALVEC